MTINKASDSRKLALPVILPLCLSLLAIIQAACGGSPWLGIIGAAIGVAEIVLGGGWLFALCVMEAVNGR